MYFRGYLSKASLLKLGGRIKSHSPQTDRITDIKKVHFAVCKDRKNFMEENS